VLGRRGRQSLEAGQLTIRRFAGVLGEVRLLDSPAQLGYLGLLGVLLAGLALDGLQLLAQVVLALTLLDLRLDL
jgi:hypothetical protein